MPPPAPGRYRHTLPCRPGPSSKERERITAAIDDLIAARGILDSLVGHPL
ncbi:hypothetical protein [Streptomyces colonosanans]|nr:hypothetical protein [Streptomyces colonosanans]